MKREESKRQTIKGGSFEYVAGSVDSMEKILTRIDKCSDFRDVIYLADDINGWIRYGRKILRYKGRQEDKETQSNGNGQN